MFVSRINDVMEINATEKSAGIAILFRAFRKEHLFSVHI